MASNTTLVKCEMSQMLLYQALIFLYQKFTKSAKKCSQGFNPTLPGGWEILPPGGISILGDGGEGGEGKAWTSHQVWRQNLG